MKLFSAKSAPRRPSVRAAFTLVEMIVSVGIYLGIFVGALVAIQIFALRVYTLAATKLTATQGARKALNQIRDDIRQGKGVQVGNYSGGTFTPYIGTNQAKGNAIQVFATTNGNFTQPPYCIYYLLMTNSGSTSSNSLIWLSVSSGGSSTTANLASYITNSDVFAAEDCWGNTITNCMKNNQVFTVKLQFYQWEYPIAVISSNAGANAYDYYQLRTKVCRRALD